MKEITETIQLLVTVKINYRNKKERNEAIKTAKKCTLSSSTLGSVGAVPKKSQLYIEKQHGETYIA